LPLLPIAVRRPLAGEKVAEIAIVVVLSRVGAKC
jgi:hypothetical protein